MKESRQKECELKVWMLGMEAAMTYEWCLVGPGKHAASYRRWVLRRGRDKQATGGSFLVGLLEDNGAKDSSAWTPEPQCPIAKQLWAKLRETRSESSLLGVSGLLLLPLLDDVLDDVSKTWL